MEQKSTILKELNKTIEIYKCTLKNQGGEILRYYMGLITGLTIAKSIVESCEGE